jgi:hypothetical protein
MKKLLLSVVLLIGTLSAALASNGSSICTGECMTKFASPDYPLSLNNDSLYSPEIYAPSKKQEFAQAGSVPLSSGGTTVIKGSTLATQVLDWLEVAFGGILGSAFLAAIIKGLQFLGIKTTDAQKAQLQALVVNGINDGFAKAKDAAKNAPDIDVKNTSVVNAIDYVQRHGSALIQASGLDPKSGEAVEAIRARIETALNDPATPTPPAITPMVKTDPAQPFAPGAAA